MKKVQQQIHKYAKARGWDKPEPANIAKSIVIEGAELLELFQWDNSKREKVLKDKELVEKVKDELADVFIYCFDMAVTLSLDSEKIVLEKLKKVEKKYPVSLVKGSRKNYLALKQAHRKKHA